MKAKPKHETPSASGDLTCSASCKFCDNERQLKPDCTRQRWSVCREHFMIECPLCGHEAFWLEEAKAFFCFSLSCNWKF